MAIQPPIIQLIHASDAPQHAGELKSILLRMKSENRISDFFSLDISASAGTISFKSEDRQGIIVLLTKELESDRPEIEKLLKNITLEKQEVKLIEIIVDNLPYHNNFISFPQDLMPIRSRVDMNSVWNGIEEDLRAMFPRPELKVEPIKTRKPDLKKYLILAGVMGFAFLLFVLIFEAAFPVMRYDTENLVGIFWLAVPAIIYVWHRKDLELATLPSQEKKRIDGFINWKHFAIRNVIVWGVIFFGFAFWSGGKDETIVAWLSIIGSLPFLLYRLTSDSEKEAEDPESGIPSPIKKSFKFIGNVLFSFLMSMAFWWFILIAFDVDNAFFLFIGMTIITTVGLVIVRSRKKK